MHNVVKKHGGVNVNNKEDISMDTILLTTFDSIGSIRSAFEQSQPQSVTEYSNEQYLKMIKLEWLTLSIKHGSLLPMSRFKLVSGQAELERDDDVLGKRKHLNKKDLLATTYINDGWAFKHKCPLNHPNKDICNELEKIMHYRYLTGDSKREFTYAKAIAILAGYPRRVCSQQEAIALKGIGPKIASLISEFIDKGRISLVEELSNDPKYAILDQLCGIYGVGPKTAKKWHQIGIRNVEDVMKRSKELALTKQQQYGLQYYDDMTHEMTRAQVEQVHEMLKKVLPKSTDLYPSGGYRRGKLACADVDVLVHCETNMDILEWIVSKLGDNVKAILSTTQASLPDPSQPFKQPGHLGDCLLLLEIPGQQYVRRVDIVHVPSKNLLPWAQLGWTGSRQFERSIRLYAERELNILLSSNGAFCKQGKTFLHAKSEEECFEILKLEFIEPWFRNC